MNNITLPPIGGATPATLPDGTPFQLVGIIARQVVGAWGALRVKGRRITEPTALAEGIARKRLTAWNTSAWAEQKARDDAALERLRRFGAPDPLDRLGEVIFHSDEEVQMWACLVFEHSIGAHQSDECDTCRAAMEDREWIVLARLTKTPTALVADLIRSLIAGGYLPKLPPGTPTPAQDIM